MKMVHYHHIFNIFTVIEILFSSLQRTMLEFFFFIELRYQPLLERNIIRSRWITTLDRYHRDAIFSFFFFFFKSTTKLDEKYTFVTIVKYYWNKCINSERKLSGKKISREILRGEFAFRINFEKKRKVTIQIQVWC